MEVEIICRKMIKPSAPTPPHLRILKLSPVDQVQYSVKPPFLFYYSGERSRGSVVSAEEEEEEVDSRRRSIINRLETSLSETLTRFYPLAGRYIKENNWVDCNDEGVEFFVAKVKGGRLSEFLSRRDEMIDQLADLIGGASTSSVTSVQINTLECGGLVIGFRVSHHLFDAFSAVSFVTSWATTSQGHVDVGMDVIWPTSILPANALDLPKMKPMPPLTGDDDGVTKRIVFDGAAISALRAISHDPTSFPRQPTRVELVTALIWRARMRVSLSRARAEHGHDSMRRTSTTSLAVHTMNIRPRIVPPLPPLSLGNLQGRVTTRFTATDSDGGNTELPELKDLVGLLIDSLTKSKERVVKREDVFPVLLKTRNELHEAVEKGDIDVYMFTSMCRFPIYDVDCGWGKPVWVSRLHAPYQATFLFDAADGDGIEAWVTFKKRDMPLFLRDTDILAFTSNSNSG